MAAAEAVERHERVAHVTVGPLARRAALLVAILAAFLAVSEVLGENAVKSIVTTETQLVAHELAGRHENIDKAEAKLESRETAHHHYEFATVFLQVGIVLASVAALIGVAYLLYLGGLLGLAGLAFLIAGILA